MFLGYFSRGNFADAVAIVSITEVRKLLKENADLIKSLEQQRIDAGKKAERLTADDPRVEAIVGRGYKIEDLGGATRYVFFFRPSIAENGHAQRQTAPMRMEGHVRCALLAYACGSAFSLIQ